MINQYANIEGMDALLKAMDELSQEITVHKTRRIWNNAMRYAMIPAKETAQMLIKSQAGIYATHQLENALYIATHRPTARDKRSSAYMGESYIARVSVTAKRDDSVEGISSYTTKKGKVMTRKYIKFHGSNRPVALAFEFGTPRRLAKLAAQIEFGTPKLGARPFMRTAFSQNVQKIQERLARSLWHELTSGKYAEEAGLNFTGSI